jgi:hypothetical protein
METLEQFYALCKALSVDYMNSEYPETDSDSVSDPVPVKMAGNGYLGSMGEYQEGVETWECYAERFEQFFKANSITDDAVKAAVMLTSVGSKKYQELRDSVAPQKLGDLTFEQLNAAMAKRYSPECTVVLQRFRFHTCTQKDESITEFIAKLRRLSTKCEFKTFLDEALRDQFVCGVKDGNIQKKLLGVSELTFDIAQKTALAMEAANKDCLELQNPSKSAVNKMTTKSQPKQSKVDDAHQQKQQKRQLTCFCCGERGHIKPKCQHLKEKCGFCKIKGHMSKVCRQRKKEAREKINHVSDTDSESSDSEIYKVTDTNSSSPITVDVLLNGNKQDLTMSGPASCVIGIPMNMHIYI